MEITDILSRLQKVRARGTDCWVACCPAHEDNSPSLTVKHVNRKTLLHCFGGCEKDDVLGAMGLSMIDLFDDPLDRQSDPSRPFSAMDALRCLNRESAVIALIASDIALGNRVGKVDADRAIEAAGRIATALEVVHGW